MKNILLVLAIVGILPLSTNAQTKGKSQYDQNFKVCIKGDKYAICDDAAKQNEQVGRDVKVTSNDRALHMFDTYQHLGYSNATASSTRRNPRIRVSYEDPNGAYEGKETRINDGVEKNKARNLNYLDNSMTLPPSDGSGK